MGIIHLQELGQLLPQGGQYIYYNRGLFQEFVSVCVRGGGGGGGGTEARWVHTHDGPVYWFVDHHTDGK